MFGDPRLIKQVPKELLNFLRVFTQKNALLAPTEL